MVFFFGSFVYSLLVFALTRFSFFNFKAIIIVKFCHFIGILKEIILQKPQFLLNYSFTFVLIDLSDCSSKSFIPAPMAGFCDYIGHNVIINKGFISFLIYIERKKAYLSRVLVHFDKTT
jgi:hypothetical protein